MTDYARLRITSDQPVAWATRVELNGVTVPVTAVHYSCDIATGVPSVTLTFPAVIDMDVALETGQLVVRQSALNGAAV